ncbi:unnamed protein product [Cochlearia groenlandica]
MLHETRFRVLETRCWMFHKFVKLVQSSLRHLLALILHETLFRVLETRCSMFLMRSLPSRRTRKPSTSQYRATDQPIANYRAPDHPEPSNDHPEPRNCRAPDHPEPSKRRAPDHRISRKSRTYPKELSPGQELRS